MILVDVHCHLTNEKIDVKQVIENAKKAGVVSIISNGIDYEDNKKVLELSKKYKIVKPALGIYPLNGIGLEWNGTKLIQKKVDVQKVLKQIENNNPIAIGEVGIDYKYGKDYAEEQIELFKKIIKLAEKMKKPLIIHSRNAEKIVIELLENCKTKVLMHCFSGNKKLVKKCIEKEFYFSIPPIIKNSSHFEMITELCPLSKILTETDSPWLSPYPNIMNEPAFVLESLKKISNIKKITLEECSNQIFKNYKVLFE